MGAKEKPFMEILLLIALGGSSYVYRGWLKDGSDVAVKRLKDQRGPEADYQFFTEVAPNLASVFFAWSILQCSILSR